MNNIWSGLGNGVGSRVTKPRLQADARRISLGFSLSVAHTEALRVLAGKNRSLWLRDVIDRELDRLEIDIDKLEEK